VGLFFVGLLVIIISYCCTMGYVCSIEAVLWCIYISDAFIFCCKWNQDAPSLTVLYEADKPYLCCNFV